MTYPSILSTTNQKNIMSAGMLTNDEQIGLEMAWHKLTKVVPAITTGFSFEYEKARIGTLDKNPDGDDISTEIPGWYYLRGSDDKQLIGNPQFSSYSVLTNERFFALVKESLAGTGAVIQSIGTFGGRAKRYATIKLGTDWEKFTVGKREFQNFLNIQDAVDASMPLIAKGSNTCVVCQNTFNMSLGESSDFRLSLRHTKFMSDKLENFNKAIDAYAGTTALFKQLLEDADTVKVTQDQANRVALGWLTNGEEASVRTRNQANRISELFVTGKGNEGRTALDLVSAVTDYYTHESSGGDDRAWKQFSSSEMGSGARDKAGFIRLMRTDSFGFNSEMLATLEKAGERSLDVSLN